MTITPTLSYLTSSIFFILSIRFLASPKSARQGNILGTIGMLLAIITTLSIHPASNIVAIIGTLALGACIGIYSGLKVKMTSLPQMIAIFNGLGGLSAVCIALAETISKSTSYLDNSLGLIIGAIAFSGSIIAFAKLQGIISAKAISSKLILFLQLSLSIATLFLCIIYILNGNPNIFYIMGIICIILGVLMVIPIGGADMPVVISLLNSYSGWACVGIGFSLQNPLLIIVGSIVGASGAILSYIMIKAMNRSLTNVLFGGIEKSSNSKSTISPQQTAQSGSPEDAAFIMENANKIIIVPGYGMAAAQAQHALKAMADELHNHYGVEVKYAIHPVAGRMPGHMNVLLAEANVPYDDVFELEDINREFATADVAYIIGANDITNPLAKTDSSSPIYGMPILDVEKAKTVFFVKRSLGHGYSGIENPLFFAPNTIMLYGDAKKVTEDIVKILEST
ncbi:MAG: NAD(P)(+) transhydrogenase (Re/Si-specific) subunit beta [Alphaproteobacteria bacterium]|nr:NAD(P)(+) transhydrogenase (Re/Si-specific) subunit beta [Alphaproteobacteria bacterium]